MTTFTFHTDPGHGWLEVSAGDLRAADLTPQAFSRYSYRATDLDREPHYFLEEDCDASIFIEAWTRLYGAPQFREAYRVNTFVRKLARIHSDGRAAGRFITY